jgi:hypothetical protein
MGGSRLTSFAVNQPATRATAQSTVYVPWVTNIVRRQLANPEPGFIPPSVIGSLRRQGYHHSEPVDERLARAVKTGVPWEKWEGWLASEIGLPTNSRWTRHEKHYQTHPHRTGIR